MSLRLPYRGAGIAFIRKTDNGFAVFMGKRSRFPFFASWSIPGGSIEKKFAETDFQAACRELFEETHIDIETCNSELLGCWTKKMPFFKWTTFFLLTDCLFENAIPHEFFRLKWVEYKKLKKHYRRPFTMSEMKTAKNLLLQNI